MKNINPNSNIHSSVVIEGDVNISSNVVIGAYCHLIGPITIGKDTIIESYSYLKGPMKIGTNNNIGPNCIVGSDGEHRTTQSVGEILIGNNNIIRDGTVIQRGTGKRNTEIKNHCYIMANSHIAHDNFIADDVTLSTQVVFAGHTIVLKGATVGICSITHQFTTIGAYSMIGMGSVLTKDVPPFSLVFGSPAKFKGFNSHQINKLGLQDLENSDIFKLHQAEFLKHSRRIILQLEE